VESEATDEPMEGVVVLLDPPREILYEKINHRVTAMVQEGLVEEVQRLLEAGYGPDDPGMTGAGYREVLTFLSGEVTLEEATEEIRRSHRRYARRQTTWNRHQLPADALVLDGSGTTAEMADRVLAEWGSRRGGGDQ
jgi:tRNA dimethylallyltransferase